MSIKSQRFKGLIMSLGYVLIYFGVTYALQTAFVYWQSRLGIYTTAQLRTNLTNSQVSLALISAIISMWIYMLIGSRRKKPLYREIGEEGVTPAVNIMAVCLALGMRFLVTVFYVYSQNVQMLKKSIDDAAALSPQYTGAFQLLITVFALSIALPLFEEILFRGIVMGEYLKFLRPWAAIALQAVLFGIAHGVLFQSIFTFGAGVILGIVYYKTRNIRTSALCHSVFNISVILAQSQLNTAGMAVFGVAGILLTVFPLVYIVKFN